MDIIEVGTSSSWKMTPIRREDREKRVKCEKISAMNLVDPELELVDPNPDIHQLFVVFNDSLFYGALGACTVEWSKRMTSYDPLLSFGLHFNYLLPSAVPASANIPQAAAL